MTHPRDDIANLAEVLDEVRRAAGQYLAGLAEDLVRAPGADAAADPLDGPLPARGTGGLAALRELAGAALPGALRSAGPRFFHFVVGGTTPAALAADWLASAIDQNAGMWESSPFAARLESIALDWLKDLFGLPRDWGAVLVTGGTMANYVGLACARRWWGLEQGIDVDEQGLAGLEPPVVLTSGHVHASAVKALGMLGLGRGRLRVLSSHPAGHLDLGALRAELAALNGSPAIVVATAGEPNAAHFDPLAAILEATDGQRVWVHVDGAFGLFARVHEETAGLLEGVERADSVASDGHKWLNVPHDCGFAFVRDPELLSGAFGARAAYYVGGGADRPNWALLGPESSRRARALSVWATLRAYGREGYAAVVRRCVELARRLARAVEASTDLELLAEPVLNVVCFRCAPPGFPEEALDGLNRRVGRALLEDGRVYAGTTTYAGRVAFRPAIVNYRTTERDVDLLVRVVEELCAREVAAAQ